MNNYKVFEIVNPSHPDKVADRIAGAIVDLAYTKAENPKVAAEVLLGHGKCNIIVETSETFADNEVKGIVDRIAGPMELNLNVVPQDEHLADNQKVSVRCGDNGIFKGCDSSSIELELADISHKLYAAYPFDGKYIIQSDGGIKKIIICQSHMPESDYGKVRGFLETFYNITDFVINPLGPWTGGTDVDSGATNRKLGSDMGECVTGGGLHGKDCTKADVSMNIECFRNAVIYGMNVSACCGIGDDEVTFVFDNGNHETLKYDEVVLSARKWISNIGGFEKFAEWGFHI